MWNAIDLFLFEQISTRITRIVTRVRQRDACTPVHMHQWPAVHHVMSWSAFIRRDENGVVLVDTRVTGTSAAPGAALWGAPLGPHSLENVGESLLHIVSIEVKHGAP